MYSFKCYTTIIKINIKEERRAKRLSRVVCSFLYEFTLILWHSEKNSSRVLRQAQKVEREEGHRVEQPAERQHRADRGALQAKRA